MATTFVKTLNATHLFLHMMGLKVAPSKSFNCASHPQVKKWIDNTKWDHVQETFDVVTDFSRRVMQIRRTAAKVVGAKGRFKWSLLKYANKNKTEGKWPSWYPHDDGHTCAPHQPHPST